MRWFLLLLLVTAVWFLVHAADGATSLMKKHLRGVPPGTKSSFSIMPGMIVMPIVSMAVAFVADRIAGPWGFRIVALLHLIWGVYLFAYIAITLKRVRRLQIDGQASVRAPHEPASPRHHSRVEGPRDS
jgi:hypothetical protein